MPTSKVFDVKPGRMLVIAGLSDEILDDLRTILERKIGHRRGQYRAAYESIVAAIDTVLAHKATPEPVGAE
jgi:hypothetical protein